MSAKTGGRRERENGCRCARKREREGKERPSIRKRGKRRERMLLADVDRST